VSIGGCSDEQWFLPVLEGEALPWSRASVGSFVWRDPLPRRRAVVIWLHAGRRVPWWVSNGYGTRTREFGRLPVDSRLPVDRTSDAPSIEVRDHGDAVRVEHGEDPRLRIVVSGRGRERMWLSPRCRVEEFGPLFAVEASA
jgi:hypothetical protein